MRLSNKQKVGALLVAFLATITLLANAATRAKTPGPEHKRHAHAIAPTATIFTSGSGPVQLTGRLDRTAVLQGGDGLVKMELVLEAAERTRSSLSSPASSDLLVVLDRSGSMSGEKLARAKEAVQELIAHMADQDRLALIAYSSTAELTIPLSSTARTARDQWRETVRAIGTGGGTNMSAGLDLALEVAARNRRLSRRSRLLLISDGHANEGDPTLEGLIARATRSARQEIVLSAIGVGEGFDEFLMSSLADSGAGNFYYLQHNENLATIFANELSATRDTVASALSIRFATAPGVRVVDAAGYPLEHEDGVTTFHPGSLFAGQERRIWVSLELPADRLATHALGSIVATYRGDDRWHSLSFSETPRVACVADERQFFEAIDAESWQRAVIEEDYNRLQQEVARDVQTGRKDEALKKISSYLRTNTKLNQTLDSDAVEQQLRETEALADEVERAFVGAGQKEKQNQLSKSRRASGWDGRRIGSKKPVSEGGGR